MNATVNPNGGEVTKCEFEYGTTNAYGSSASCASLPGSGESPVAVSAPISGLAPNTTYHFRISATNAGGTSKGADETFKTLPNAPTVVTDSGIGDHRDDRHAERDRQPQRRGSHEMRIRIRHEHLQINARGLLSCCPAPGRARSRCPRRSRALLRTPPTTSGSPRRTRAGRAKDRTSRSKHYPTPRRS